MLKFSDAGESDSVAWVALPWRFTLKFEVVEASLVIGEVVTPLATAALEASLDTVRLPERLPPELGANSNWTFTLWPAAIVPE